jgi:phage antirepressor YoqD-like protein
MSVEPTHALAVRQEPVAFEMVPIAGDHIAATLVDGVVWVSLRRMCEALGLDEEGQRQKLTNETRTPWATTFVTQAVAGDGRNRLVFCLDLDSVPMWLATIDSSRVSPAARPKVIAYQREAARVLRDHFLAPKPLVLPSRTEFARMLLAESERADKLEAELKLLAPKADFYDQVAESTNTVSIAAVAKTLNYGRNRFFNALRGAEIIEQNSPLPRQEHIDAGRFVVVSGVHQRTAGPETHFTAKVTGKGFVYLAKRFGKKGVTYLFPAEEGGQEAAE